MVPRLLERYRRDVRDRLSKEFGYKNLHQVPTVQKVVREHRPRRGDAEPEAPRTRGGGARADHRPEADHPQGAEVRGELQAARGSGHRLHR